MAWFARRAASDDDRGFTLVEVVVGMMLMSLVLTGVGSFFLKGISSTSGLDRRQSAISLANQTMETVRAVPPTADENDLSKLIAGRTQAAVNTQWASAPAELSTTARAWDAAATGASTPVVPLTATRTVGGQRYTVDVFVGTCRQSAAAATCTSTATGTDLVTLYRVVVRVAWSPGAGATCSGSACQYLLTTLIDPTGDQTFNSSYDAPTPVAVDDAVSMGINTATTIAVLTNDTGTFNSTPVSITQLPAHGTVGSNYATGTFSYTPDNGYHGTDTLTYKLTDSSGQVSNVATVTITVTRPAPPTARAVSLSIASGGTATVNLVTTNTGTFGSNAATITSGVGATVAADGTFTYTPASSFYGTASFTYRLTDTTGQTATNTITVTVARPAPPTARAISITIAGGSTASVNLLTTNTGSFGSAALTTAANGATVASNGAFSWTPALGYTGTQTWTYRVTDVTGQTASNSITVVVNRPAAPTAQSFSQCIRSSSSRTVDLEPRITGVGLDPSRLTATVQSGGSNWTASRSGWVYTFGWSGGSASNTLVFRYTVTDAYGQASNTATVSLDRTC